MKKVLFLLLILLLASCSRDSDHHRRGWVEGKIEAGQEMNTILVTLESGGISIAEDIPDNSGAFAVSGPMPDKNLVLRINRKIAGFSSSDAGITIAADSTRLILPEGKTYVKFNSITLQQ